MLNINPLISIVMPTYNRADFIIETIESIQKQTYRNWELIIVDDGSTDNTSTMVEHLADDRISYYKEPHFGMENARNTGLRKTNGELIAFMDSDDLWAKGKLEKQVSIFEEHPEVSFCLTSGFEFERLNEPMVYFYKQRSGVKLGDLFIPFFKSEVVALPQTLVFKRSCIDIVKFPEHNELAHIHFILNLAFNFKGAILYEPLLYRRMHTKSYSAVHREKRHYDGVGMIKHYKRSLPKKIFINSLFKTYINFGEECLRNSQKWKAIKQFLQAWKHKPLSVIPAKKMGKTILHFFRNEPSFAVQQRP